MENKSKVNLEQQRALVDEETKRKEAMDNLFKMAKAQENLVSSHKVNDLNAGVESDEWDD